MTEIPRSWIALAGLPSAAIVLTFIGWAPAPAGFLVAAAAALAWCRWAEAHPRG
ncbi:MAG TPA: hypothetical protein VM791_10285 [Vicinamibacterales bacterium]|nr:hypothetical protein [Vicinamibacterales bacterium]